eukprot:1147430-Pelagomonas_calceolata.AAC.10
MPTQRNPFAGVLASLPVKLPDCSAASGLSQGRQRFMRQRFRGGKGEARAHEVKVPGKAEYMR